MAELKKNEIREIAMAEALTRVVFDESAEKAGKNAFAIPITVNDSLEVWVECKLSVKQWYDTHCVNGDIKTKAYDPFEKQSEWENTLADREKKAEQREQQKQERLKRKAEKEQKKQK